MHYLLFYELGPDYLERRGAHRAEHLKLAWQAQAADGLVLGGALAEPSDRAVLLFQGDSPDAAKRFANADPYVRNGLVKRWEVRTWTTVVGNQASMPVHPE
ncbi:MAG: YciI-like protein [Casimicrobiaceae bacterium]